MSHPEFKTVVVTLEGRMMVKSSERDISFDGHDEVMKAKLSLANRLLMNVRHLMN